MIAGLGNPGERYANTPHNVGFDVVDELARRLDVAWRPRARFQAHVAGATRTGTTLLLVKPQTFMNLSGSSVAPLLRYFNGSPDDLTVILDDADLPAGRMRIRGAGGSGGHRGLASVIAALGTDAFARVRVGVGREAQQPELAHYVLEKFDTAQQTRFRELVETAADAALCLIDTGLNETMNRYNGWTATQAPAPTEQKKRLHDEDL